MVTAATIKSPKSGEKSTVAQLALSARNDLDPNVIAQNTTLGIANAAGIVAVVFPDDGNTVNTDLNATPKSSK